jgi:hypothetical protein
MVRWGGRFTYCFLTLRFGIVDVDATIFVKYTLFTQLLL